MDEVMQLQVDRSAHAVRVETDVQVYLYNVLHADLRCLLFQLRTELCIYMNIAAIQTLFCLCVVRSMYHLHTIGLSALQKYVYTYTRVGMKRDSSSLLSLGRCSSVLRSASVRVLQVSSRWTLLITSSSELLAKGRRVQQTAEISTNATFTPIFAIEGNESNSL